MAHGTEGSQSRDGGSTATLVEVRFLGVLLVVLIAIVVGVRFWNDRPEPRPWNLTNDVKPSATRFEITIDSGQCHPRPDVERIEVAETAETVTVTPYVDPPGSPFKLRGDTDACLALLSGVVRLDQPLGARELLGAGGGF